MIPIYQTQIHDPENGVDGNCLSATLASLLHLRIEDVPIFKGTSWVTELNDWLRPKGLAYLLLNVDALHEIFRCQGVKEMWHEAGGPSQNHKDVGHSVVAKDLVQIHDPHPGNKVPTMIDSVGLFVVLRPWEITDAS